MASIEFVLVVFSIVVGLSISTILAGWAEQLRARSWRKPYPLQLAVSAAILLFCFNFLWSLWTFRDLTWTFPLYVLFSLPAVALSLAAHLTTVDTDADAPAAREQYFASSGPIFLLFCLIPISIITMSFVPAIRGQVETPQHLPTITAIRLIILAVFLAVARSKRESLHWLAVGMLVMAMLVIGGRTMVQEIGGG